MLLTKKNIKETSKSLLNFLNEHNINTVEDLSKYIDHEFFLDKERCIYVLSRPSNFGTKAISLNYDIRDLGIPLEAVINQTLKYSQVILKSTDNIPGHLIFGMDIFGNKSQYKKIPFIELEKIKTEFEILYSDK